MTQWGVWVQGTVLALAQRPTKGGTVLVGDSLTLTPKDGVVGDHGKSKRRQVTILDASLWEAACVEAGTHLPWTKRRANILTQEIDLQNLVGKKIRIGTATVQVLGEVDPCHVMDEAYMGLKDAMKHEWRGGVYARILKEGTVKIDDKITLIQSSQ